MKVYLMTDLEGVAGVYTWENRADESLENHERRCRQRRWLAREVNAAADGVFVAGAHEVLVNTAPATPSTSTRSTPASRSSTAATAPSGSPTSSSATSPASSAPTPRPARPTDACATP